MVLFSLFSLQAQAQLLRGRIADEQSGEPLAAATIQVEGTYRGTITNAVGSFELVLVELPAFIVVRHIGYATRRIEITSAPDQELQIALSAVAITLQEIVVTGEDPAIAIMREVIERKKVWRTALKNYEAVAYSRYTISNDTGIVFIRESVSNAYWDHERGMREVLTGTRKTLGRELGGNMAAAGRVINLYADNIYIAGHDLIGVTHPDALDHYDFSLVETRSMDDAVVYDISVEPRNRFISGFKGRVAVHGHEYALLEAELRPGDTFLFPYPLRSVDFTYRQQFSSFGGEFWLPVDFRFRGSAKVNVSGLLRFPEVTASQVSRFTDYEVNGAVPEDLFASERYMRMDSAAVAADTMLTRPGVAIPLLSEERMAYARTDTVSILEAFEPKGPLARLYRQIDFSDFEFVDTTSRRFPIKFNRNYQLRYNRVEALHAGLGATVDLGKQLQLGAGAGRSTGPHGPEKWSYHGRTRLTLERAGDASLEVSYRADTATRHASSNVPRWLGSIVMLAGGEDYFDYYRSEGYRFAVRVPALENRLPLSVSFRSEEHTPLSRTTNYAFVGSNVMQRANPAIGPGRLEAAALGMTYRPEPDLAPGPAGQRSLSLELEHSTSGSDYNYGRYELAAEWSLRTVGQKRLLPAMAHFRLVAGTSTGELPSQRMFFVEGGVGGLRQFGSLHTRQGQPYEGRSAVAFFWEHDFRTMPFELLGLRMLAGRGYNLQVFGGHARTWTSETAIGTNGHHELGVSVGGFFGVGRISLAWRPGKAFALGFGVARIL